MMSCDGRQPTGYDERGVRWSDARMFARYCCAANLGTSPSRRLGLGPVCCGLATEATIDGI
jgi:hypothetical protein